MPPAFNLSQDQTLQFDTVCLITLAGTRRSFDSLIPCVSTNDLSSAGSIAVRLFDPVAPFIKRPHLSAVSFLKSESLNFQSTSAGRCRAFCGRGTGSQKCSVRLKDEQRRGEIMRLSQIAVKQRDPALLSPRSFSSYCYLPTHCRDSSVGLTFFDGGTEILFRLSHQSVRRCFAAPVGVHLGTTTPPVGS